MATISFDIPDNLVRYATGKGIFISEWVGQLTRETLAKMEQEEIKRTLPRVGFLKGRVSVPADFDTMGQNEIAALFEMNA